MKGTGIPDGCMEWRSSKNNSYSLATNFRIAFLGKYAFTLEQMGHAMYEKEEWAFKPGKMPPEIAHIFNVLASLAGMVPYLHMTLLSTHSVHIPKDDTGVTGFLPAAPLLGAL